jgi:hypothetical protein
MVRRAVSFLVLCSCIAGDAGCALSDARTGDRPLLLRGFRLVDPGTHRVEQRDLFVSGGRVAAPNVGANDYEIIDGRNLWLLPALWDLNALPWGNLSAEQVDGLAEKMSVEQSLRVELYYGVAHVGASTSPEWQNHALARIHALEMAAADVQSEPPLCGAGRPSFACIQITTASQLPPLLDLLKNSRAPHVRLFYGNSETLVMPPLGHSLLEEALAQAGKRGLKGHVVIDDWEKAEDAVRLGAAAIQGLPDQPVPDTLITLMREKGAAYVPTIAGSLELARILGNEDVLADPFLTASVPSEVLQTFRDPQSLWSGWRPLLEAGRALTATALANLRRFESGGVRLLSATDAGLVPGSFQGDSTHTAQQWMERAGLEAWTRLSAVTIWPAEFAGRHVGFAAGDPADFVVLSADPLAKAAHLREIAFIVRNGSVVQRDRLKPDLKRSGFPPQQRFLSNPAR